MAAAELIEWRIETLCLVFCLAFRLVIDKC